MRIKTLLFALVLAGCYSEPLAPDYALGTYRGTVIGGGSCLSPAAELTVTVVKHSAFGDWYPEQQNLRAQFACAWVNEIGFFAARRSSLGGLEYVFGYFAKDGSALDATIDVDTCRYTGMISRASPNTTLSSASVAGDQLLGERCENHQEGGR
jgi:hypothetical protein